MHLVEHIVARHETVGVHLDEEGAPLLVDDEVGREEEEASVVGPALLGRGRGRGRVRVRVGVEVGVGLG